MMDNIKGTSKESLRKTNVIVNLQIEGLHYWADAEKFAPQVAFLSYPHRHIFHICAKKAVSHDDRDVEIILFKREIDNYLHRNYNTDGTCVNFGGMSCEMICRDLMDAFDLVYCSITEDNENGAEIWN